MRSRHRQRHQSIIDSSTIIPNLLLITRLYAENNKKRNKGVYVRPSGAIERGSGFFVPGLEGSRVRVVVGSVLLLLTAINHIILSSGSSDSDYIRRRRRHFLFKSN